MENTAQFADTMFMPDAVLFGTGVALVLVGLILRLKLSHHWMRAEEQAKDGRLSEDQARRRIAIMRYTGPLLVVLGMAAFAVAFWH